MNNSFKPALLLLSLLGLAACGGGGGSDSSSPNPRAIRALILIMMAPLIQRTPMTIMTVC